MLLLFIYLSSPSRNMPHNCNKKISFFPITNDHQICIKNNNNQTTDTVTSTRVKESSLITSLISVLSVYSFCWPNLYNTHKGFQGNEWWSPFFAALPFAQDDARRRGPSSISIYLSIYLLTLLSISIHPSM